MSLLITVIVLAVLLGLTLGMLGGGGAILAVPIFTYLLHIPPLQASAYSLFVVAITSAVGAGLRFAKGELDVRSGFLFALPALLGSFLTRSFLLPLLPAKCVLSHYTISSGSVLLVAFSVVMILSARSMLRAAPERQASMRPYRSLLLPAFGVGCLAGALGAGGGFLIVPVLVSYMNVPMKRAVGTSLFAIALQSAFGFLGDYRHFAEYDFSMLLQFALYAVLGTFVGVRFTTLISAQHLRRGFGYFLIAMAVFIVIMELFTH